MKKITYLLVAAICTHIIVSCTKKDFYEDNKVYNTNKVNNQDKKKEDSHESIFIIEDNILRGITDKKITSVVLPSGIKEIANNVFEKSEIIEIRLNEGLETIGNECFLGSKIKKSISHHP